MTKILKMSVLMVIIIYFYNVDKRNISIERACRIYTIELSNNENINFSKPYFAILLLILSMIIVIYETRVYEKIYRFNN